MSAPPKVKHTPGFRATQDACCEPAVFARPADEPSPSRHSPPPVAVANGRSVTRKRLWEVSTVHHCVLLGAAFDERELRQMFRRSNYAGCDQATDYHLHSSAVSQAATPNAFSRLAQRKLDERYKAVISAFRAVTCPIELMNAWQSWSDRGEVVAAYWAAITHPTCNGAACEALSQEMHMAAHSAFIALRAASRRVRALEDERDRIQAQFNRTNDQCNNLRTQIGRLRADASAATASIRCAEKRANDLEQTLERLRSGEENARTRAEFDALLQSQKTTLDVLAEERRLTARLTARIAWLEQRLQRPCSDRNSEPILSPDGHPVTSDAGGTPSLPDLADACVLCVGGRASLVPKYRDLLGKARAEFLYHDGGLEDHLGRLPALLATAHAVICFSGEVSHAAYRTVKRYCKVRNKPCALIQQPSMTGLTRALATLSELLVDTSRAHGSIANVQGADA